MINLRILLWCTRIVDHIDIAEITLIRIHHVCGLHGTSFAFHSQPAHANDGQRHTQNEKRSPQRHADQHTNIVETVLALMIRVCLSVLPFPFILVLVKRQLMIEWIEHRQCCRHRRHHAMAIGTHTIRVATVRVQMTAGSSVAHAARTNRVA